MDLFNDVRVAVRGLIRAPSFTIAAVVALGLGVGSTAAVFSLLEGVVLRPLPYREPDRLVSLWEVNREKGLEHEPISPVNFGDYRALRSVFEDLAAWWRPQLNLVDDVGDPVRVAAIETTQNLFAVLGVRAAHGRTFQIEPQLFSRTSEVVISHRLWQTRFGASPSALGRGIRLNGYLYTIVGVMPPGFAFPGDVDVWQQLAWDLSQHSRGAHFMESIGRLRPGVTPERANRELAALGGRLGTEYRATNLGWNARVVTLDRETAGVFRPALIALLGASALLLLIACINVANLLLARATARRREVAVRAAIGASRSRLMRLFLTESVVLAGLGAALGLVVAVASVRGLLAWSPIRIPRADEVSVDVTVLVFATLVAAVTALAFGLAPALLTSRAELQDALKDGAKGSGTHGRTVRGALVVAEVALAVMLLLGAGLLIRSVAGLLSVDTGVDPTSVVTVDLQLPEVAYRDWARVDQFYTRLAQGLRERPEIVAAGLTTRLPLDPGWRVPFRMAGEAPVPNTDALTAQFHTVDEGYFDAVRARLVRGRQFGAHDGPRSVPVVMVNETMARQVWPGADPIGKRIVTTVRNIGPLGLRVAVGDEHEVIGVVADVKNTSLRDAAEPAMYFVERQFPFRKAHVVVRGRGDASRLGALLRDDVRRLDPSLPLGEIRTMSRVLATTVDPPRFVMLIMAVFAAIALALAAVGIYGVLSYAVSHRRREFGIRLALGAQPGSVLRLIVREGLALALAGCAIGVAGAYLAGRSLSGFLYGVSSWDPLTVGGVLGVAVAVAAAACIVPGWRASREDPVGALRAE